MIDDCVAKSAIAALHQLASGRWDGVRAGILDDGATLLLSIDDPRLTAKDFTTEFRAVLARALNDIVPSHQRQELGSWMVVFLRGGVVFASVYPGPGGL